jgi:tetratricopeptide (TPR) repeat protein
VQSLTRNEKSRIYDIVGADFPLFLQQQKNKLEISAQGHCTTGHRIETLTVLAQLYVGNEEWEEAARVSEQVLSIQPAMTRATLAIVQVMAMVLKAQGKLYEAFHKKFEIYEFTVAEFGDQSVQTLIALDNLSLSYVDIGDLSGAEKRSSQALELAMKLLGPIHLETITVKMNRALILSALRRLDEAIVLAESAFIESVKILGAGHQQSIISLDNLATFLYEAGDRMEALKMRSRAYCTAVEHLGFEHHTTLTIGRGLEGIYEDMSDWNAIGEFRMLLVGWYGKKYGETDERTLSLMNGVLRAYMLAEDWDKSKAIGETLLATLRKSSVPTENSLWAFASQKMMRVYILLHDYQSAVSLGEQTVHLYERSRGLWNDMAWNNVRMLTTVYQTLKDWPNAIRQAELAVRLAVRVFGWGSDNWLESQKALQNSLEALGNCRASYGIALEILDAMSDVYGRCDAKSITALMDVFNIHESCEDISDSTDLFQEFLSVTMLCLEIHGENYYLRQEMEQAMDTILQESSGQMRMEMVQLQYVPEQPNSQSQRQF